MWCLGVLTYELCTGRTPFGEREEDKIQENIRNHDLVFPPHLSSKCVDFIRGVGFDGGVIPLSSCVKRRSDSTCSKFFTIPGLFHINIDELEERRNCLFQQNKLSQSGCLHYGERWHLGLLNPGLDNAVILLSHRNNSLSELASNTLPYNSTKPRKYIHPSL